MSDVNNHRLSIKCFKVLSGAQVVLDCWWTQWEPLGGLETL